MVIFFFSNSCKRLPVQLRFDFKQRIQFFSGSEPAKQTPGTVLKFSARHRIDIVKPALRGHLWDKEKMAVQDWRPVNFI